MKLLLELSMECESLARSEAIHTAHILSGHSAAVREEPGVLVVDTEASAGTLADRIALCHVVSEYLGSCASDEVESFSSQLDVPGPVRVHATRIGAVYPGVDLEAINRRVGGILGASAGVDIHRPVSEVRVVYSDDVHFGRRLASVDRSSYESRKTKELPYNHPISLHPKYARCLVNLALSAPSGRVLDPFCGTGAIVAEAALMGCEAVGTDMQERMVDGTGRNLAAQGLQAELSVCDVGAIGAEVGMVDAISTDPPYGRSTSTGGETIPELMTRAFRAFSEVLDRGRRISIVLHDMGLASLAEDFELIESHELWVHRSLTRRFCVLEKR